MTSPKHAATPPALPTPERVQQIAALLFNQTASLHGTPEGFQTILTIAASAYTQACAKKSEHPERTSSETLLRTVLDLAPTQHIQAACVAALQAKKLRPEHEPTFVALGERGQQRALSLAALLSMAYALAQTSVQRIHMDIHEGAMLLRLDSDGSAEILPSLEAARKRWEKQIGPLHVDVSLIEKEQAIAHTNFPAFSFANDVLESSMLAGDFSRHMLRRFFEHMLACEEAIRKDNAAEDVHQMRIATRRLRAMLQAVTHVFDSTTIRGFRRSLRQSAHVLGNVRDLDVFLENIEHYAQKEGLVINLQALHTAATHARDGARTTLQSALHADRYRRFRRDFARFLTTPDLHVAELGELGRPPRVRDIAGSALWQRYEQLRAFEDGIHQGDGAQLHHARIAGKRLRYTLEFYRDILGPDTEELLRRLTALQDQLGLVQDRATAHTHITALEMLHDSGAQQYLRLLEGQRAGLLEGIPQLWERATGADFRRLLQDMILTL